MDCPVCKKTGAYVGFSQIECVNPDCNHFSLKQASENAIANLSETKPKNKFDDIWNTYITGIQTRRIKNTPAAPNNIPVTAGNAIPNLPCAVKQRVVIYRPIVVRQIIGKYYPDIPKFMKIRPSGSVLSIWSSAVNIQACLDDYEKRFQNGTYKKEETTE